MRGRVGRNAENVPDEDTPTAEIAKPRIYYDTAREGTSLQLDAALYDDATFMTWQPLLEESHTVQTGIEERLAAVTSLPAAFLAATGTIATGSAMRQLYMAAYARTVQLQRQTYQALRRQAEVNAAVFGETVEYPDKWMNVWDYGVEQEIEVAGRMEPRERPAQK